MSPLLLTAGILAIVGVPAHGAMGGVYFIGHLVRHDFQPLRLPAPIRWLTRNPDNNANLQRAYLRSACQLVTADALVAGAYLTEAGLGVMEASPDALLLTAAR